MTQCPVCGSAETSDTVSRERLPAMQNLVYRSRADALEAADGRLTLAVCKVCAFAWNRAFDPDRLVYDENYDNAVPSTVMDAYYREIATYLGEKYLRDGGLVVDVGCGDGAFLRTICAAFPATRGLGIDPALDRTREEDGGRVTLVKDVFSPQVVHERPALVLSRHVLEHIADPVGFLCAIRDAIDPFEGCPCFFEVPDLRWIIEHHAFWDFCYEHCNYFTAESFREAASRASFEPIGTRTAFGSQYLWLEAAAVDRRPASSGDGGADLSARALEYARTEAAGIAATRDRLRELAHDGYAIAVWGMATKGVLLSLLVDPDASLIDYSVDVNPNKQGCFVPLTGHTIRPPTALREAGARPLAVLVMNANYRDEIEETCRELGIDASVSTLGDGNVPQLG